MTAINRQARVLVDGQSVTNQAAEARAGATAQGGAVAAAGAFIANGSIAFDTSAFDQIAIDITVAALTGGVGTIQFLLERQGSDGLWYLIKSTTALAAAGGTVSISAGPGCNGTDAAPLYFAPVALGGMCRIRWISGGAPTGGGAGGISVIGK